MFEPGNLEDVSFTINESYAKRFEHNKKREELHRLEEKYGKDSKNLTVDSSSSGSEEDEDAMYDSIAKDKGFLRVLSKLKSKDPAIYDQDRNWFGNDEEGSSEGEDTKKKKEKPMFLKDYERETLLKKGSLVVDSDEDTPSVPTYTEEQRALKEDLKSALDSAVGEEPLLTLRSKTDNEQQMEDEDYRQWLKGEKSKIKDKSLKSDCDHLKKAWSDPNLDENERFLRDFILNKGWAEDDDKDFVPTYDEIINDDDEEIEQHDVFERQFNFRFEEPDHELIKNYPRTIANSVRKNNEGRKERRKRKQERKLKEKEETRQEIERLKKLKFDEIETKLQKLSDNAGTDLKPALEGCLDEDFNPEEHDKVMSKLFDEEYYQEKDAKKPVFSDSDDDLINDEEWFKKIAGDRETDEQTPAQDQREENISCDDEPEPTIILPEQNEEGEEEGEGERTRKKSWKRKRSKKFKEAVVKPKPSFNPDDGPFERYFDDYYKLDCEDVIGDVKCRFGYRKTKRCTYGLTIDEILLADDKELNQWYSFKKMMKYRTPGQEAKDGKKFQNKRHNEFMKRQILKSLYPDETANEAENSELTTKKKSNKKMKLASADDETEHDDLSEAVQVEPVLETNSDNMPTKKKKKKKGNNVSNSAATDSSTIADIAGESDCKSKGSSVLSKETTDQTTTVVSANEGDKTNNKKKKKSKVVLNSSAETSAAAVVDVNGEEAVSKKRKKKSEVKSGHSDSVSLTNIKKSRDNVSKAEPKKKGKQKKVQSISQSRLEAYGLS